MKVLITRLEFEYNNINVKSMADNADYVYTISRTTVQYMLLAGDWKYENSITLEKYIYNIEAAITDVLEYHKIYL